MTTKPQAVQPMPTGTNTARELLKECLPIIEEAAISDCYCDYDSGDICYSCTAKNLIPSVRLEVGE